MTATDSISPQPGQVAGIRCPRCQTVNYEGLLGFPHCHNCHEQLRQCRYCRLQQHGLCQLDDATRPPLREDDGLPWCAAFETRHPLTSAPPPLGRAVMGSSARLVAVLAVGTALLLWLLRLTLTEDHGVRFEAVSDLVRVVDGRATVVYALGDGLPRSADLRLAVDLREAPGYAVEELVLPPGLRAATPALRTRWLPREALPQVEVHLVAAGVPGFGRLSAALETITGQTLATAGQVTLRPASGPLAGGGPPPPNRSGGSAR